MLQNKVLRPIAYICMLWSLLGSIGATVTCIALCTYGMCPSMARAANSKIAVAHPSELDLPPCCRHETSSAGFTARSSGKCCHIDVSVPEVNGPDLQRIIPTANAVDLPQRAEVRTSVGVKAGPIPSFGGLPPPQDRPFAPDLSRAPPVA